MHIPLATTAVLTLTAVTALAASTHTPAHTQLSAGRTPDVLVGKHTVELQWKRKGKVVKLKARTTPPATLTVKACVKPRKRCTAKYLYTGTGLLTAKRPARTAKLPARTIITVFAPGESRKYKIPMGSRSKGKIRNTITLSRPNPAAAPGSVVATNTTTMTGQTAFLADPKPEGVPFVHLESTSGSWMWDIYQFRDVASGTTCQSDNAECDMQLPTTGIHRFQVRGKSPAGWTSWSAESAPVWIGDECSNYPAAVASITPKTAAASIIWTDSAFVLLRDDALHTTSGLPLHPATSSWSTENGTVDAGISPDPSFFWPGPLPYPYELGHSTETNRHDLGVRVEPGRFPGPARTDVFHITSDYSSYDADGDGHDDAFCFAPWKTDLTITRTAAIGG